MSKTSLQKKNILVIWAGISGLSAIKLLLYFGANVYVLDEKIIFEHEKEDINVLRKCSYYGSNLKDINLRKIDLAIVAPRLNEEFYVIKQIKKAGIEIINEIELGSRFDSAKIVAVTGTNGKTTTSYLCYDLLKKIGKKCGIYGNMGRPYASLIYKEKNDFSVLEVSSQHLHFVDKFSPFISIITNITQDHLNEYNNYKSYVDDKKNIFRMQNKNNYCIANYDCQVTRKSVSDISPKVLFYSKKEKVKNGAYYTNGKIYVVKENTQKKQLEYDIKNLSSSYIETALILVCLLLIVEEDVELDIEEIIGERKIPYRLEDIGSYAERKWINDSKATNPYSTIFAIDNYPECILISGSNCKKKSNYYELATKIARQCKSVILFGESKEIILNLLRKLKFSKAYSVSCLKEAVDLAYQISVPGDCIVFSPGGNSSPLFENLEERGKIFNRFVKDLNIHLGNSKNINC